MSLRDGSTVWRECISLEHDELCRRLNLDPVATSFDLPRSATEPGSKSNVSGYVLRDGAPIGTLHVAREGSTFRDLDPTSEADFWDLRKTR